MASPDPRAVRVRAGRAGIWLLLFGWCLRPEWDIDVFFHVAIGREVLLHGIPSADVFSAAHPDAAWTPFQLGYALLVAWVESWGGLDGLRLLHAAVYATAFLVLGIRFRASTGSRLAATVLTVLALALFEERLRMRPHAFVVLFEGVFLLPLAAGTWRSNPGRWRLGMLGLAALWAFVHSMAVAWLLAVVLAFVVFGRDARERKQALGMFALGLLGVAVSPGALGGIAHVLSISDRWAPFVPELRPSWAWFSLGTPLAWLSGAAPWVAIAAVVAAASAKPPPERRAPLAAALGLALGSVAMVRLGYYAAFAIALAAPEIGAVVLRPLAARFGRALRPAAIVLATAVAALLVAHVAPRWAVAFPWTTTLEPGRFPVTEVELLRKAGVGGLVWNETDWGGYLLYEMYPDARVVSDGRVTFQPDVGALLLEDERPSRRGAVAEEAFRRYGVDLLVRRRGAFPGHPEWELLLRGPVADVWSRKGPVTEARKAALSKVLGHSDSPPGP